MLENLTWSFSQKKVSPEEKYKSPFQTLAI